MNPRSLRRRLGKRKRDERGSMTVFVVLWSLVIVMVAALVIDVGLAISQRERAADIADQAARAEAQNLSIVSLRQSGGAVIQDDGCRRATDYLAAAAASVHYGSASLNTGYGNGGCLVNDPGTPGNSVTVSVNVTYSPFVFDLFSGTVTVTETGTATAATGN
ncbi:Tad domain-containing protein [Actinospica sp. MGRD01-02]|uniref:Tad domain-containing protein n=1 Tax=Actinospica acidithermotolerans TaxID=2828514 RepID=A0A941ECB4_9ACTN|nr:Tad domain-containing protein [Actinospica acidithermotolerans]MBR7828677.1 Tad domain-containing protein [Actinospica acidithermotolerans]